MIANSASAAIRQRVRRDLLHQYVRLQQELTDGDPACSSYQGTIHAFRQVGYALISSGFEDDLDRLLRIRVIAGGRPDRQEPEERGSLPELHVLELRRKD